MDDIKLFLRATKIREGCVLMSIFPTQNSLWDKTRFFNVGELIYKQGSISFKKENSLLTMQTKLARKHNSLASDVVCVCGVLLCFFSLSFSLNMSDIATLNVNGAREMRKRAEIFEAVKQKKIDVVMLQETHSDLKNAADWAGEWNGVSVLSHNTSLSGGVAILFAKSFSPHSYQVEEVVKGRFLIVRATFENFVFVFMCVYIPTSAAERMLFLNTLCSALQKCSVEEYLLFGGDFNCTVSSRNHVEPHLPSRNRLI